MLTPAEKQEVGAIEVVLNGHEKLGFKLDNGKWKLESGKVDGFDSNNVDAALTRVGAARAAEFLGKKPVPSGNEELSSWVLLDKSGKKLREFKVFGNLTAGDYYARLSTGELAKLKRGSGSAVPFRITDFQTVKAADADKDKAKAPEAVQKK